MIEIYTDGAQSSKDKSGGWAFVVPQSSLVQLDNRFLSTVIYYNKAKQVTNNQMELQALIQALNWVWIQYQFCPEMKDQEVCIYTDSAYIANCFKDKWYIKWQANGWRNAAKEPVKNKDMWETILSYYNILRDRINIQICKVAGHTGDKYNSLADKYAVKGRQEVRCADEFYVETLVDKE